MKTHVTIAFCGNFRPLHVEAETISEAVKEAARRVSCPAIGKKLKTLPERRLVSYLSDHEKSRLLHHLLQKREWDGLNGRPWNAHLHGQAEREIQMLVSR